MNTLEIPHPPVVNQAEWLKLRKELLKEEKELTRHKDRVNAQRRRLPMVKLEKEYKFDGPNGEVTLLDLFQGRHQLIVHHFMFDPEWERGCAGCISHINAYGNISALAKRDTSHAVISRAPFGKLAAYKAEKGWTIDWYSSFGSDFNYDFHATLDEKVAPIEYNYRTLAEMEAAGSTGETSGEAHGMSVFFRVGDDVFHTYSSYARGVEAITDSYSFLDLTPYGRQEDFEESPTGWPQEPTYG
jgi:predicted dithiol-disulfide oxidoreductase (DUF899 family)